MAGRFVTFEGVEGAGKSLQLARLAERLAAAGLAPAITREPGGTGLGRRLRALLLDPAGPPLDASAELLLYAADRAQHLVEVVEPALAAGRWVLCDRYLDATVAYQGYGRELGAERVLALHRVPPLDRRPDRTLVLDLDPAEALERARRRDAATGAAEREGRFEAEALAFHRRVAAGYRAIAAAEPDRVRLVDATGVPDAVAARVFEAVADLLPAEARA